jgi:large subunit ribosomal protein L18
MATQSKKLATSLRAKKKLGIRKKLSGTDARPRLSVFRSSKHTYAQLISDETNRTIASASTLDKEVVAMIAKVVKETEATKSSEKSVAAAHAVGIILAERCKAAKVEKVVFDRNGFLYTGRVKALADGARKGGLDF